MKLYAYAREAEGDRLIHVWEAERLRREHPESARLLRYYSTELDHSQRREVVLVCREGRLFFRYKELPDPPPSASAQTLTHLKAKEILSRMTRVRCLLPEGELTIWAGEWQAEKRIPLPGGELAIADLSCEVLASQPPETAAQWQGKLLVEVVVTHPSTPERLAALQNLGWPVIEITIGPRWHIPEGPGVSEKQVRLAEEAMERGFRQGIRARIAADPRQATPSGQGLWSRMRRFIDEIIIN